MIIDSKVHAGECSCGKHHEMQTKLAVVEAGCLSKLDRYLEEYGLTGFRTVVYDENTVAAKGMIPIRADREAILEARDLHANEKGVEKLLAQLPEETKVLVAVGAGTIHDITRYCAYIKGIPFVSCPTAASVDGFCSSVAAMTWEGAKKTLTAVAPVLVLADLNVISQAPMRLTRSGFGDMIGKYIALTDWRIGRILTGEFYCDRIADMTQEATKAVMEAAEGIQRGEKEAYEVLTYGLLLSGLAMQMMGNSRPASGAEHHISHAIEMEPEGLGARSDCLHGEKVGVATVYAAREYHRLATLPASVWGDYPAITQEQVLPVFGQRLEKQILKENEKDCAAGIAGEKLSACWGAICRELAAIPPEQTLVDLYRRIGAMYRLEELGVPEEKLPWLLENAPLVRNRLTLMRLRRCLK